MLQSGFTIFSFFDRDHMQWSKEEAAAARKKVEENSAERVLLEEQGGQPHLAVPGAWLFFSPPTGSVYTLVSFLPNCGIT